MILRREFLHRIPANVASLCNPDAWFSTLSRTARQEMMPWGPPRSGIFAALGLTSGSVNAVPMTEPFAGTVEPQRILPPKKAPKTHLTTLPNGFKLASEDIWGTTCGIGFAVASGSQYEDPSVSGGDGSGISHFLEYMAFRGTQNRTHFRVMQELLGYGAHTAANVSREQTYYSVECLRTDVAAAVEVLCDVVANPKFNPWEVEEVKDVVKSDLDEFKKNPQGLLSELLTGAVYQGGLGNPLISSPTAIDRLDHEKLLAFYKTNFTPDRMALAVGGISHDALLKIAEPIAGILPVAEEKIPVPQSQYVGGEIKKPDDDELCHVILAFDVLGGWEDVKSACVMTVLMYLMGGGGSFSSGGPGKGMHSRLYLNVLTRYGWVQNFTAVSQAFDKRCLTGVYGAVPPTWAPDLINVMCEELNSLSKDISDVEINRAKNAAIGQVLMTLESRATAAEDIARQVLTYGHRKAPHIFIEGLQQVTKDDLKKLVSNMLKKPLSMASMGSVANVPHYSEVARRFG